MSVGWRSRSASLQTSRDTGSFSCDDLFPDVYNVTITGERGWMNESPDELT